MMRNADNLGTARGSAAAIVRGAAVATLLLLLGASGCAYYNTFFLAKKYYNQALTEEKLNTTGKVSPSAVGNFDKSITQCAKILKRYPDSKWVDDALFLLGKAYYGKESFAEARRHLNTLVTNYPKSPFVTEGRFWMARTWLADGEYERARAEFAQIMVEAPNFPQGDQILLYTGDSYFREENYAAAAAAYGDMLDRYPRSEFRTAGLLGLGDAQYEARQYEEAGETFRRAVLASREPRVRFDARIKAARCLEQQDRFDEALDNYQAMTTELVSAELLDRILHGTEVIPLAPGSHQPGDETALDQLRYIDENGVEVIRNPAFAAQNPPGMSTTPNYDPNNLNDPRNPNSPNYDPNVSEAEARARVAAARTAGQYLSGNDGSRQAASQALAANPLSVELPRVMLRQGQVLSQLGEYEQAIDLLKAVNAAWPRTSESAEALFRIGYIQEVYLEDYDEAHSSYDAVRQQGQSIYADQASRRASGLAQLRALDAADSLKTGGDLRDKEAEKDFLAAELAYFQQDKPDKALEQYEIVEEKYPGSPFAARAAMARAWIFTNVMRDTTAGRFVYESILEKYPDTEQYRLVHQILTGEVLPDEPPVVVDTTLAEGFVGPLPEGVLREWPSFEAPEDSLDTGAAAEAAAEAAGPIRAKSRLVPEERTGLPRPVARKSGTGGGDR